MDVLLAKSCCPLTFIHTKKISAVINTSNTVILTSNKNFNLPEIHPKIIWITEFKFHCILWNLLFIYQDKNGSSDIEAAIHKDTEAGFLYDNVKGNSDSF